MNINFILYLYVYISLQNYFNIKKNIHNMFYNVLQEFIYMI